MISVLPLWIGDIQRMAGKTRFFDEGVAQ